MNTTLQTSKNNNLIVFYSLFIMNSILAVVISIGYWFSRASDNYLPVLPISDLLAVIYTISMQVLSMVIPLAIVSIIALPIAWLSRKKFLTVYAIMLALLAFILILDVTVYHLDALHLVNVSIPHFVNEFTSFDTAISDNKMGTYAIWALTLFMVFKFNKFAIVNNWFIKSNKINAKYVVFILTLIVVSQLIYFTSNTARKQQLLAYTQRFPLYARYFPNYSTEAVNKAYHLLNYGKPNYPLQALQTATSNNPPNILIVAIDAWRADYFNQQVSPNLWQFAQQGKVFSNHYSAANRTHTGLFGLFYGIPATHKPTLYLHKKSAVFFDRLTALDYQINLFTVWDKQENQENIQIIVGNNIKNLHLEISNYSQGETKDERITKDWLNWYAKVDKSKPWFSFVFYDSLHGPNYPNNSYKDSNGKLGSYKQLAARIGKEDFIDCYSKSVSYIDSLAAQVLQQLAEANDLDNTIVIITADHGNEFNDNSHGEWGYGTNFTDCQIKVPFAIILPDKYKNLLTQANSELTSHYDVTPTIMKNFLGVTNPIADYSIGFDLFDSSHNKNWHLATNFGGYSQHFALVSKENISQINNSVINLLDLTNKLLPNSGIDYSFIQQAVELLTKYLK